MSGDEKNPDENEKELADKAASSEIPAPPASEPRTTSSSPVVSEPPLVSTGGQPAAPAQVTTEAKSEIQPPVQPKERRSRWESSFVALRYLSGIGKDGQIKVRDSDRATSVMLAVIGLLTVVSIFIPTLAMIRFNLLAVCDLLAGVCIVFYIANRFGILSTLPPRSALLCWQLMMGSWFIGIFVTINVVLIGFLNAHHPPVPETRPVQLVPAPPNSAPAAHP
ncbi:MAG TPA: hypothetical protein V6C97_23895 [Oculatellaceae cyanobacterium]